jgi:protein-L-isoaspartate O-methyltransferase
MGRAYDATCGRLFTAWYGLSMRLVDELGLRETRRAVLAEAHGRTLDIGSGTGANVALYAPRVEELFLAEPDAHMRKSLRRRLADERMTGVELVQDGALHDSEPNRRPC